MNNTKKLFSIFSAILLVPEKVFAHAEHTFTEEAMLFLWMNPLASLGLATLFGVIIGGGTFFFRRNKKVAFNVGIVCMVLAASVLFMTVGTPPSDPSPSAPQQLSGAVATVYKSATCGCCGGYIEELKRQGANVDVQVVSDAELAKIKMDHSVAPELHSCHTSIIDGYVVEGHVPIEVVAKLRTEQPKIRGIALPGMPSGTPGMPGPKLAPYDVRTLDGEGYLKL